MMVGFIKLICAVVWLTPLWAGLVAVYVNKREGVDRW